jgi:flavorubredoxin
MDHSSSLPTISKLAKNATIICSERGKDAIIEHYGIDDFKIKTVKSGDEVKLGKRTLKFIDAAMLHWPDSMFTYIVEDKILMPNDAFGQHLASEKRFDSGGRALLMRKPEILRQHPHPARPLITKKIQEVSRRA